MEKARVKEETILATFGGAVRTCDNLIADLNGLSDIASGQVTFDKVQKVLKGVEKGTEVIQSLKQGVEFLQTAYIKRRDQFDSRTLTVHENTEPLIKVKLIKGQKESYGWEISVREDDPSTLQKKIDDIDAALRAKYVREAVAE